MNKVIELRGTFYGAPPPKPSPKVQLPVGAVVTVQIIQKIRDSLSEIDTFWSQLDYPFNPLVSIQYREVIAKSNRMGNLLKEPSKSINKTIVGSKFSVTKPVRHIITHCIKQETIQEGLKRLELLQIIVEELFKGAISAETLNELSSNEAVEKDRMEWRKNVRGQIEGYGIKRTSFFQGIKDCWYIECFTVEEAKAKPIGNQLVTFYDLGVDIDQLSDFLGIPLRYSSRLDHLTYHVTVAQYQEIMRRAPYLVAMAVEDLGKLEVQPILSERSINSEFEIPEPRHEPTIGVIDTQFDTNAYFSSWVEYHREVASHVLEDKDYEHGTAVSSIIVDGPALNPFLEDGCGRFRVRHFGVAKREQNSSFYIIQKIQTIVESNPDIKVWNLSLGSPFPIDQNTISAEAALLDRLQYEKDVLFVVAGTNTKNKSEFQPPIGSPADSVNSIVVNASTLLGEPTNYARRGPVLHFFNKPDLAAFGGDTSDQVIVFSRRGRVKVSGTSYAAPWIARKAAYLIHVLGFSREIAKALLVDSAASWELNHKEMPLLGYGVVPRHINDILNTPKDQITFLLHGVVKNFETYSYSIPVPRTQEGYPYRAKVTCCYFPKCTRSQGVDYPDSELDVKFGRLKEQKKTTIHSIDNNRQGESVPLSLFEREVRTRYRKWDPVKHFSEKIGSRNRARKQLNMANPNWGISIKAKERLDKRSARGLHFGMVVTIKAIDGVNRISQFMQLCRANGWIVNEVDIDVMAQIHEKAEEHLVFTE